MTGAQLAAALAGGLGVPAAWDAIGVLQDSRVSARVLRTLAPLRSAGRAGEDVSAGERRRLVVLLAATLLVAGGLTAGPWAGLPAAAAGPWVAGRAVAMRRARFRRGMAEGAGVAARSLADALAGGHSVRGALAEAAAAGGAGPAVDAELRRARAMLAVGARTEDVLEALRRRAAGPAWDTLVAAILLQREAGGDLAALLRDIAAGVEAVRRVQADARAVTAQARFTAGTVALLPVGAAVLGELAAPGTTTAIAGDPLALTLGAGAVVLQVTGILVVMRLSRPGTPAR